MPLVVVVPGTPAPKGSKTRTANGGMVESSKRLPAWREAVRHEAYAATHGTGWVPPLAVAVTVTFTVARPALHYGTGRNAARLKDTAPAYPTGRPDVDKLARAVLDALTDAGVITDDARVVSLLAEKCFPGRHPDALDTPGAVILVWAL